MDSLKDHPDVERLLQTLLKEAQAILDERFVGMYLFGSLTSGDFDKDSDIDVVVVTAGEISEDRFSALRAMHEKIYAGDSPWTIQLEVSYIPRGALRRYDPADAVHPHIDRGSDELLMVEHDESWTVQRHVLRERGITLAGPAPQSLIDPVSGRDLREAMVAILDGWAAEILRDPARLGRRGGQSYAVLSICRILYTLQHGSVVSKRVAARWAQGALSDRWTPLIEGTWAGRENPERDARPEEVSETLAFIRYARERGRSLS